MEWLEWYDEFSYGGDGIGSLKPFRGLEKRDLGGRRDGEILPAMYDEDTQIWDIMHDALDMKKGGRVRSVS